MNLPARCGLPELWLGARALLEPRRYKSFQRLSLSLLQRRLHLHLLVTRPPRPVHPLDVTKAPDCVGVPVGSLTALEEHYRALSDDALDAEATGLQGCITSPRLREKITAFLKVWTSRAQNVRASDTGSGCQVGVYRRGGVVGLTRDFHRYPNIMRLLTGIVKQVMPSLTFNALSLSWCACFQVHRDVHNEWDTPNVVIPFLMPATGGDLWLSLVPGDVVQGEVQLKELPDGKAQAGQVLKLKKWTACSFDARRWHATTSYGPDEQRLVLVAYTAAIMRNLQPGDFEALRAGGFPLGAHTCPAERCVGADLPSSVQPGESALFAVPVLRKSCEPGEQPLVLGKSEAHALPVLGSSGDPGESNTCATHVLAASCELGEQCVPCCTAAIVQLPSSACGSAR